jgi:hypothetical protein
MNRYLVSGSLFLVSRSLRGDTTKQQVSRFTFHVSRLSRLSRSEGIDEIDEIDRIDRIEVFLVH